MKIAVTATGSAPDSKLDIRFGRAAWFVVFDTESGQYEALENSQNLTLPQGAGIQSAAAVVNAGCSVLITAHCGPKAFSALSKAGVQIFSATDGTVREVVEAYKKGSLKKSENADVQGHW